MSEMTIKEKKKKKIPNIATVFHDAFFEQLNILECAYMCIHD